jgi:hypothetical protein
MRGRIFAVASLCSGSACLDLAVVTRRVGALLAVDLLDLADVDAGDPHRRVGPDRVGRLERP